MIELGKYRPEIRKYEKGDVSDDPRVAARMAVLDGQGRWFWVLVLPHPEPRVLACHTKRGKLMGIPEPVAKGQMTFKQWQVAVEAAVIKEIENKTTQEEN
jgi:hypothetical protein